jgi:hypothetical protein
LPRHAISQEKENKCPPQLQQVRCSKKLDSCRRWLKGLSSALGGHHFLEFGAGKWILA